MNIMVILITLVSGLFSFCTVVQAAGTVNSPIEAVLAGQQLRLINEQGRCALTSLDGPRLNLDMKWPCYFSRNREGVRVENFRQNPVIMVERSEPMPAPGDECITDLQAIRHFKGKLEAAPVSRIASCGPGYWDQKAFLGVFDW